ncbi:MAG: hypothetical protein ABIC40_05705, partial [bacterium]
MHSRNMAYILLILGLLAFMLGCSGRSNPVLPEKSGDLSLTAVTVSESAPRALWGLWQVRIDAVTGNIESIPLRTAEWHINAVTFLEKGGVSKLLFKDVLVDGASVELNVGLQHPFITLYQWSGFDVRGIFISDGSYNDFQSDGDLIMSDIDEPRLINADGWARWWNPTEFPIHSLLGYKDGILGKKDSQANFRNTLNAYKYFSDDLTQTENFPADLDLARRGIFTAKSIPNWRHYSIDFGAQANWYIFNYAVDASHRFADDYNGTDVPDISQLPDPFFPIEANQPEAFAVEVEDMINTLYYESETSRGGDLQGKIRIYDWQGLRRDGGIPDEVADVLVESPTLINTQVVHAILMPTPDENYSTYRFEFSETLPDDVYNQQILVTVVSSEGDFDEGYDGYSTNFLGAADLAAYYIYTPEVSPTAPVQSEYITVISPNGGESWTAGDPHDITWTSVGVIDFVKIEYSDNNGGIWHSIIDVTANDGIYEGWNTTGLNSDQMLVRVSDASPTGTATDVSDSVFEIVTPVIEIVVTAPNGGEVWLSGTSHNITWTAPPVITFVLIEYSTNNGGNWNTIDGGSGIQPNNGTYLWNIAGTLASGQMLIKVSDAADGDPFDTSDATFVVDKIAVTIPNGATDIFYVGTPKNITWTTVGGSTVVTNVKIEFSKTGSGGTFVQLSGAGNVPNTGSFSWNPVAAN